MIVSDVKASRVWYDHFTIIVLNHGYQLMTDQCLVSAWCHSFGFVSFLLLRNLTKNKSPKLEVSHAKPAVVSTDGLITKSLN